MALSRGRARTAPAALPSACFLLLLLLLLTSSSLLSTPTSRGINLSSSSGEGRRQGGGGCAELQSIAGGEARCAYLRAHSPCSPAGYVDYLRLFYCGFRGGVRRARARAVAGGALLPPGRHRVRVLLRLARGPLGGAAPAPRRRGRHAALPGQRRARRLRQRRLLRRGRRRRRRGRARQRARRGALRFHRRRGRRRARRRGRPRRGRRRVARLRAGPLLPPPRAVLPVRRARQRRGHRLGRRLLRLALRRIRRPRLDLPLLRRAGQAARRRPLRAAPPRRGRRRQGRPVPAVPHQDGGRRRVKGTSAAALHRASALHAAVPPAPPHHPGHRRAPLVPPLRRRLRRARAGPPRLYLDLAPGVPLPPAQQPRGAPGRRAPRPRARGARRGHDGVRVPSARPQAPRAVARRGVPDERAVGVHPGPGAGGAAGVDRVRGGDQAERAGRDGAGVGGLPGGPGVERGHGGARRTRRRADGGVRVLRGAPVQHGGGAGPVAGAGGGGAAPRAVRGAGRRGGVRGGGVPGRGAGVGAVRGARPRDADRPRLRGRPHRHLPLLLRRARLRDARALEQLEEMDRREATSQLAVTI